jgi:hypothetical protein
MPSSTRIAAAVFTLTAAACASSSRDATHDSSTLAKTPVDAAAPTSAASTAAAPLPAPAPTPAAVDAGPTPPANVAEPNVKVVTIGMHVAGGPFDEPTKEPFKKAVEPHFPEIAQCWAKHVTSPPKQADVGVDLLIEPSGGRPKVSNPRANFDKGTAEGFVPCVIAVFESVEFPSLAGRGRTGVSYSLRLTRR